MTSNFDVLQTHFPQLYQHARHTEQLAHTAPRASCFYARFSLEQAVLWLYDHDPYLQLPYDHKLGALIHEQTFRDNLKPGLFPKIRTIHKVGNDAVHNPTRIGTRDSQRLTEELFHVLYWLCRYYSPDGRNLPALQFDPDCIPRRQAAGSEERSQEQLQALAAQLTQTDELRRIEEKRRQQTETELAAVQAELAALKQQNAAALDRHDYNEADTRRYLIDDLLREAGWNPDQPGCTEVPVSSLPTPSGDGRIDYVLWGNDGKPLALVEAKRSQRDASAGQQQAKLYADALEQQFGQRPVIFYTNGYETWLWDDCQYPPRQVQGFLKQDELERAIFRRQSRKRLSLVSPNPDIINRSYQREAIQRLGEIFQRRSRKALLVMATGTGKTRTAIALVDVLIRANWVKRVLFLADRNILVTQARAAFAQHLPTVTPIDLTESKEVEQANVVISTYPTMLNFLEQLDSQGRRRVGPGHFDLVIVDEAHRSIYQKYSVLFDYFDALLVGLTATPRDEVHRDTYRIFELETGNPTFAYELNDAVQDGYLVPAQGIDVPFKFLRTGLRYADLSPEEQAEYDSKFRDEETGALPDQVNAAALNRWLFNANTVDQALEILMEFGLKVEGGDRLGKTIIFARNHDHAAFIVERFNRSYPHYQGHFARVIDSHDSRAASLLKDFARADREPTIAVSVDMLDTGVDVPEAVNLVFFKPVYSRVKFNQMIGRGTRLCPDLFGVGRHKSEFLVFDLCGNFDYFSQAIAPREQRPSDTLTARLVKTRLALVQGLEAGEELVTSDESKTAPRAGETASPYQVGPAATGSAETEFSAGELRDRLLDDLHQHVASMELNNVLVRRHRRAVEEFAQRQRWQGLSEGDRELVAETLASLPTGRAAGDRLAKEFDLLCYQLQLALLQRAPNFVRLRDKLRDLLSQLETKRDIPMVKAELERIAAAQVEDWWQDVTLAAIEDLRLHLRDLVKFADKQQQALVYTDFADELGGLSEKAVPLETTGFSPYQYRKKVEAYIRAHESHVAIAKLKRNLPLTESDLAALEAMLFDSPALAGREQFEQVYGANLSLTLFVRQLVGLDRQAAKQAFARYLEGAQFSANQIRFVETIIDYLTQNGVMDVDLLYEPPFTDAHPDGLDGVFGETEADGLVAIVRSFNATVDFRVA